MCVIVSKFNALRVLVAVLTLCAFARLSHAQTVMYNSLTGTGSTQPSFHYAEQLTLSSGANQAYSISAMTFGVNVADPNTGFAIFLGFYTGADLSATSANALANATSVQQLGFSIPAGSVAAAGNYTFNLTFPAFTIQSGTFTVESSLTNAAGTVYTTASVANARFTLAAPTVGTSPGFVWSDANLNNVFTGAEQTRFGAAAATIRMSITAAVAVPEPGVNVVLACGGLVLLGGSQFRRRWVSRA